MTYRSPAQALLTDLLGGSQAGTFVLELEHRAPIPPLVPGMDNPWQIPLSQRISTLAASAICGKTVDETAANAVKSGLLLWNDDLDTSHMLSQQIHTVTGCYWHGIMHRREPDYSNAKYWFHQVDEHPVYDDLKEAAIIIAETLDLADKATAVRSSFEWNAIRFVDWCADAAQAGEASQLGTFCRLVQLEEIRLLLAESFRQATGRQG